jgi:hypothetical protein
MEFKKAVTAADKLAFEKGIGRTTLNVVEHPKANTLTIVEELTRFAEGHEIKQRFYNHIDLSVGKVNVNSEVDYLKTISTFRFLGQDVPAITDLKKFVLAGRVNDDPEGAEVAPVLEEPKAEEPKKAVEPEGATVLEMPKKEEEAKEEVKPKTRRRKAKAKVEPKAEVKEESKAEVKEPKPKKSKNIIFDREVSGHVREAALCIKEVLGSGWKEDKANTDAVKDMIFNVLHNRAEICQPESTESLPEFKELIRDFLTKRLDLAGAELDADDGLEDF